MSESAIPPMSFGIRILRDMISPEIAEEIQSFAPHLNLFETGLMFTAQYDEEEDEFQLFPSTPFTRGVEFAIRFFRSHPPANGKARVPPKVQSDKFRHC